MERFFLFLSFFDTRPLPVALNATHPPKFESSRMEGEHPFIFSHLLLHETSSKKLTNWRIDELRITNYELASCVFAS